MEVPNSVFLRVKFVMLAKIVRMVKTNPWNAVGIFFFVQVVSVRDIIFVFWLLCDINKRSVFPYFVYVYVIFLLWLIMLRCLHW